MQHRLAACTIALGLVVAMAPPGNADQLRRMAPSPDAEAAAAQRADIERNERAWDAAIGRNWITAYRAIAAWSAAVHANDVARAQRHTHSVRSHVSGSSSSRAASTGSGRCGGNLPPCYVMMRESGGSLTAQNPNSTASGKWQFLDSTWHAVTGLPGSASDYDEATQDAAAAKLYDGGAGCAAWVTC